MAKANSTAHYWKSKSKTEYSKVSSNGDGTCKFAQYKVTWEEEYYRVVDNSGKVISDKSTGHKRNEKKTFQGHTTRSCPGPN
jgi:hypothetical protein